jgi:hypothetical protein
MAGQGERDAVTTEPSALPPDFRDLVAALSDGAVDFVIVGAHALAVHGYVRATLDLDVLVRPTSANAARLVAALTVFGAPLDAHGVTQEDFARPGVVYQLGLPPVRIDILTSISGVTFEDAWSTRAMGDVDGRAVPFLGRDALIRNKRASGRKKDLHDIDELERQ